MRGDGESAAESCEQSRKLSTDPVSHTYASGFLGSAHVERGEPAEAIPLLEHVIQELARFGLRQWHGMFTTWLAEAYRLIGEAAKAQALAHRGLEIARGARYGFGVGHAQRVLGRIARSADALDEAESELTEALETFQSIGAEFEVARVRLELADLAGHGRDPERARTHLEAARRTFERLRVPRYVERADRLAREKPSSGFQTDTQPPRLPGKRATIDRMGEQRDSVVHRFWLRCRSRSASALVAAADAWIADLGDRLVSIVLFGSVARRQARPTSDIDLVLVADGLPRGLADRRRPFLESWERARTARALPPVQWNLVTKSTAEARVRSPLYLDIVEEGILILDRDRFFEGVLAGMRARMRALGSRRVFLDDGTWYWDLKPDFRFGEVVEI